MEINYKKISLQGLTGEIHKNQLINLHYLTFNKIRTVIKKLTIPSIAQTEKLHQSIEIQGIGSRFPQIEVSPAAKRRYDDRVDEYIETLDLDYGDYDGDFACPELVKYWLAFVSRSEWIKEHPKYKMIRPDDLLNKYTASDRHLVQKAFEKFTEKVPKAKWNEKYDPDSLAQHYTFKDLYYSNPWHSPRVSAFYEINGLEKIILMPGIQKIGEFSFSNLESVTTIKLPNTITRIDDAAFYNSPNLKDIVFPSSIKRIGKYVFERSGIQSFTWPELKKFHKIPKCSFKNSALQHIQLNESVEKIEDEAFRSCSNLEEIKLPDSITDIGKESFSGCTSLKSIHLPDHLTHLGPSAFQGCSSLQEIWLPKLWGDYPAGKEKIVKNSWFADCPNLKIIHCPKSVIWESLPYQDVQLDYYNN